MFVRFSFLRRAVQPYLEFLLGFNHLVIESSVEPAPYPLIHQLGHREGDVSDWANIIGLGGDKLSIRLHWFSL